MHHRLKRPARRRAIASLAAASAAIATGSVMAQSPAWPTRPVRVVVNFPAGGPLDILSRLLATQLTTRLGQPFAVENVTGAAGEIGAAAVARAQPDGYTLLMSIDAPFTIAGAMRPQISVGIDDFNWVAMLGSSGLTVAVHPSAGVRTLAELIAKGRERSVNFSTAGPGSPGHLAAAVLADATGVRATPIHYRGNAPAVTALVAGEVDAAIISTPGLLPHIRGGKLQALATAASRRSPLLPDLPSVGELGYAALAQESLYVVGLPPRTPEAVSQRLATALAQAIAEPALRDRLSSLDLTPDMQEGRRAQALLRETLERYSRTVKATGIKMES
jgi:tripartite-type tricarboxylate transporter receptor subunit TctC